MTVAVEPASPTRIPEADLWSAVLYQVVVDLALSNRQDRERAEAWVGSAPSRDFTMVCELAGIDPCRAHQFLSEVIAAPRERRRSFASGATGGHSCVYSRMLSEPDPGTVTGSQLAARMGVPPRSIRRLALEGRLDGCFDVVGARRLYHPDAARLALEAIRRGDVS